jgi:hypothetical protein
MPVTQQDIDAAKRNFYVTELGLDPMTNLSLNDLEYQWYLNPTTGGGGGPVYTAGNGIDATAFAANTIQVKPAANSGIVVGAGGISIDNQKYVRGYTAAVPAGAGPTSFTHGLGTQRIGVFLIVASTGEIVDADFVANGANTCTIDFATAPTAGQYNMLVVAVAP